MMGLVFGPSLVILWRINFTYGSWNNISNFETASHKTVMTTYGVNQASLMELWFQYFLFVFFGADDVELKYPWPTLLYQFSCSSMQEVDPV